MFGCSLVRVVDYGQNCNWLDHCVRLYIQPEIEGELKEHLGAWLMFARNKHQNEDERKRIVPNWIRPSSICSTADWR